MAERRSTGRDFTYSSTVLKALMRRKLLAGHAQVKRLALGWESDATKLIVLRNADFSRQTISAELPAEAGVPSPLRGHPCAKKRAFISPCRADGKRAPKARLASRVRPP